MTNIIPFPRKLRFFPFEKRMLEDLNEAGWIVWQRVNGSIYCSHPDITDVLSLPEVCYILYGRDAA